MTRPHPSRTTLMLTALAGVALGAALVWGVLPLSPAPVGAQPARGPEGPPPPPARGDRADPSSDAGPEGPADRGNRPERWRTEGRFDREAIRERISQRLEGRERPEGDPRPPRDHEPGHEGKPDGPGWRDRMGETLSDEDVELLMNVIEEYDPSLATRIQAWRDADESRFNPGHLLRRMPWLRSLMIARKHNPEGYELRIQDIKLDREARRLAEAYRTAVAADDVAAAADVREQLAQVVREHFEARHALRVHELKALEARIESLREQLAEREADAERLIEERITKLTTDAAAAW